MKGYPNGSGNTLKWFTKVETADDCYDYIKKNHPYADGFVWDNIEHGCTLHIGHSTSRDGKKRYEGCLFTGN